MMISCSITVTSFTCSISSPLVHAAPMRRLRRMRLLAARWASPHDTAMLWSSRTTALCQVFIGHTIYLLPVLKENSILTHPSHLLHFNVMFPCTALIMASLVELLVGCFGWAKRSGKFFGGVCFGKPRVSSRLCWPHSNSLNHKEQTWHFCCTGASLF